MNLGTMNILESSIFDNICWHHATSHGGAIVNARGSNANITNSLIFNNTAGYDGGALFNGGSVFLRNTSVFNNCAFHTGAAVTNTDAGAFSMLGGSVHNNLAYFKICDNPCTAIF